MSFLKNILRAAPCRNSFALFFAMLFSGFLSSCLTAPDTPGTSVFPLKTSLFLFQDGQQDSSKLLAFPDSSFVLKVKITPDSVKKHLSLAWVANRDTLGRADSILIRSHTAPIPEFLILADAEKNTIRVPVEILFNSPPRMLPETVPAEGDTLYGNKNTALYFSWNAADADAEDTLSYFIEIDSTVYAAGHSAAIQQSGFSFGKHEFRIWVTDSSGDSDTLSAQTFYFVPAENPK